MIDFDQLKRDRAAGTRGPWIAEKIYGWGDTPCLRLEASSKPFANFVRPKSYYTEYLETEDGAHILSDRAAREAGNYVPTADHKREIEEQQHADARRCANIHALEALALAGQELADIAFDPIIPEEHNVSEEMKGLHPELSHFFDNYQKWRTNLLEACAAWNKAVIGGDQ